MNANEEVETAIAHQASQWVTVLSRTATPAELAAFAEWIRTSPRHIRDFLTLSAIEKELREIDPQRRYGIHELAEGKEASNVAHLTNRSVHSSPRPTRKTKVARPLWAAALATFAVAAALALWRPGFLTGWQTFATATGEQRALELADGSVVHLNTRSQIRVRMSETGRDIELVSGEALFKVHRDPARPFRVYAQNTAIQAVGTEFNVYQRPEGTTVAVLEGKVRIAAPSPVPLVAGEEARIAPGGQVTLKTASDVASAVAWRQRRLIFQATSLAEMVREFNRYNNAPRFRLEGAAVEQRHYTGVFDADDPESLVELLAAEPGLNVRRSREEIVISAR